MPGTNAPGYQALLTQLGDYERRIRALEGQQNRALSIANAPARAHLAGAFSAATGFNLVPLDTEDYDPAGCFSTVRHEYTAPQTGSYQVNACVGVSLANNPQMWIAAILLNGTEAARGARVAMRGGTGGDVWNVPVADVVTCALGDKIALYIYNGGPSSTTVEPLLQSTYLSVAKVA